MQNKVLLICGPGRSGSTLLERSLAQNDSFFSVGELMYIWQRGFIENQLCGCGTPFRNCEFWSAVIKEAFGDFNNIDLKEIIRLQNNVGRIRSIGKRYYSLKRDFKFQDDLSKYIDIWDRLYSAIKKVSGCSVIIDSSKEPSHLFVLKELEKINLQIIHLVRDSRAIAYSWQRRVKNPAVYWKDEYLALGTLRSAFEWDLYNLLIHLLGNRLPYMLLRYEDMVENLHETLADICKKFDVDNGLPDLIEGASINLTEINHTVSGNPMRFQYGMIKIKPDMEWGKNMKTRHKIVITALTWPLLLRYKYI